MPYGYGMGRGFGRGGGRGFGLRGFSPPWPYVGLGRGGLPRRAYFYSGVTAPVGYYPQPSYTAPAASGYVPYAASATKEEELSYLKDQAEAIKKQLEEIDSRMQDLDKGK